MKMTLEPCWKFVNNSMIKQAKHIQEEANEVVEAITDIDLLANDMDDIEVMDVIQSCITYFAIKGYSQGAIDNLTAEMHKKNKKRGYYDKPPSCDNCTFDLCLDKEAYHYAGCDRWRPNDGKVM